MMVRQVCRLMSVAALAALLQNPFFAQDCLPISADVNNDGIVDDADLLCVLFNFGTSIEVNAGTTAAKTVKDWSKWIDQLARPWGNMFRLRPDVPVHNITVSVFGRADRNTIAACSFSPAEGAFLGDGSVLGVIAFGTKGVERLRIFPPSGEPFDITECLFVLVKQGERVDIWFLDNDPRRRPFIVTSTDFRTAPDERNEADIQLRENNEPNGRCYGIYIRRIKIFGVEVEGLCIGVWIGSTD